MPYPDVPIWVELSRLGLDFMRSGAQSLVPGARLDPVETYCFFVGAPRNGHSLIGSLLDAHPDAIIAHELGVPKYLAAHFSKAQINRLLLANSQRNAAHGRTHIHYSHAVDGQWQGRYRTLKVLGDKHGEGFLLSVGARPRLTSAVLQKMRPARFIHVVRNPYDAIASVIGSKIRGHSMPSAIGYFESLYETLETVSAEIGPGCLFTLKFEDFLADPPGELQRVCAFLGLPSEAEYLGACSSIVMGQPEDHRGLVEWDVESRERVGKMISRHGWLEGYAFE